MTTSVDAVTLTRLVLNPRHRDVARDLADCHRMHQRITALCCPPDFGPGSRSAAGVLYRVEQSDTSTTVMVQARTVPALDRLPSGYATGTTRDLGLLLDQLAIGTRVRYRIAANPTRRLSAPHGERGRISALTGASAVEWWHRRAADHGLQVDQTANTREERLHGWRTRPGRRSARPDLVHQLVQLDGTATVTDPGSVHHAVMSGIGRAKAYGCGMLSVAPLPN